MATQEETPAARHAAEAKADTNTKIDRQYSSANSGRAQADSAAGQNSNKPESFTGDLHHLPRELAPLVALPHWVLWRWEKSKSGDKWTKVPYQPNGNKARNNDPKTWSSYDTVMQVVANFDGIGFCLFNSDIAAFDIDHCHDPTTGATDPWAADLVYRTAAIQRLLSAAPGCAS